MEEVEIYGHHQFGTPREALNFTALDVETAVGAGNICQIGLVRVDGGKITEQLSLMLRPPGNEYNVFASMVNGMYAKDTEKCPELPEVWDTIKAWLDGQIIVGHNVAFDLSAVWHDVELYGLAEPQIAGSICTCNLHDRAKLVDVCLHYGISSAGHHQAVNDARMSALCYLAYLDAGVEYPIIERRAELETRHIEHDTLKPDLAAVKNTDNLFYDKKVVITGMLDAYPNRGKLAEILKGYGADINKSISAKTNIVIIGYGAGPKKLEKIEQLNASGKANIRVIKEDELCSVLNGI